MFESLDKVDWDLLHRQKLTLLKLHRGKPGGSVEAEALMGIIHLLDALQDDAAELGRWTFPGAPVMSKRYYVEDDEGRHHGPLDDYEVAAGMADAIHGRIIVQELEQQTTSEEENQKGGLENGMETK